MGGGSELALACQAIIATPAGSLGFPETGIGIYPGLGGMLRTARMIGPELAKYYVFTGATINAQDAHALGIVTELVMPPDILSAVHKIVSEGAPDKYRERDIPQKLKPFAEFCSKENVASLLAGKKPEVDSEELAARAGKTIGFKAPVALRISNEIIDRQENETLEKAVEIELGRLNEIFSTADALEGLSSLGRKRPEYKGS
jgi:enoyl-CoA hydratase/3-hydroxyacyl-CoA dehydrogenase